MSTLPLILRKIWHNFFSDLADQTFTEFLISTHLITISAKNTIIILHTLYANVNTVKVSGKNFYL